MKQEEVRHDDNLRYSAACRVHGMRVCGGEDGGARRNWRCEEGDDSTRVLHEAHGNVKRDTVEGCSCVVISSSYRLYMYTVCE